MISRKSQNIDVLIEYISSNMIYVCLSMTCDLASPINLGILRSEKTHSEFKEHTTPCYEMNGSNCFEP